MTTTRTLFILFVATLAFSWLVLGQALAQPTYSVDVQGPTFASGTALGADILTPVGAGVPPPPPAIAIPAGALGVKMTAVGFDELDALSYGRDPLLQNQPQFLQDWSFSVDEFAVGQPGVPFPSVTTEGAGGPIGEASADIYASLTPAGPLPIGIGGNMGIFDGNGTAPFAAPGLNLIEPNPPSAPGTDPGDNLDAWDIDTPPPAAIAGTVFTTPVYFSLDSRIPDPLETSPPFNTGTALSNGFVGGDVLVSTVVGAVPAIYASAASLGLDTNGTDTDDLDALVLWDNGDGVYQPTDGPYSWTLGTDMLLFSVRRGSALIGTLDTILSVPIEEGDVLVPFASGTPGIFIPAEVLGLATVRTNGPGGGTFKGFGDDLDALDVLQFAIPEPGTLLLAGLGLAGILLIRRQR